MIRPIDIVDRELTKLPVEVLKSNLKAGSARIMREIFDEDIQSAEIQEDDISAEDLAKKVLEESKHGKLEKQDPQERRLLWRGLLREDLIEMWHFVQNPKVDDFEQLASDVSGVWGALQRAGYSEEEVVRYLSYFLEPSKAEAD
ncbi:MAG: hypothetical protein ABJN26_25335 [Stappiaceae bacterium]